MIYIYEYFISFALSFIIAFAFTPVAKSIAFRIGAIDVPRDGRRMHKRPIPRLGGLAIITGFAVTILFNVILSLFDISGVFVPDLKLAGLMAGIAIIAAVGIIDDVKQLRAKIKLVFQLLAALVVVLTGTRIGIVTNPFSETGYTILSLPMSYFLTIMWIVGITNAINLIDGLDGLAAGVSSIASLSLFFVSVIRVDMEPDIYAAVITAALAGSTLGFLPYNFNPAKIFMGDTGATFLGFTLGVISIQGTLKAYTAISITVPLLALGLPLFDTVFAIIRRLFNRKPIMEADRGHLHHRLIDMGLSQKQSVAVMYATSAALGLCAIVLAEKGVFSAIILVLSVSVFIIAGARYMSELNSNGGNGMAALKERQHKEAMPNIITNGDAKMRKLKVMTVFGTRPDAVKMAPLVRELKKHQEIESYTCVTAQHRQMLDQVLEIFGIKPDFDLNIMQERQTLEQITVKALEGLSNVFEQVKPDVVLVHGDTATCFVASLAAFYKKIPVGHVEAGLRTFDKYSPFPEEMNRRLAGVLAEFHFAPTSANKANLLNEGVKEDKIYVTGNTVIDALMSTIDNNYVFRNELLKNIDYDSRKVIFVTAHRRENLGEPLRNICRALKRIVEKYEDVEVVYAVHLNPAVQETAREILLGQERVHLIDPIDVRETYNLINKCYMVMTDSGGIQEEAPALGKPVLVLRNDTERPEAVEAGTVKLAGTNEDNIVSMASTLIEDRNEYNRMAKAVNPYGDGKASQRIVQALLYEFGISTRKPEEFRV